MYELLIALIIVMFAIIKTREHLGLRVGGSKMITTDTSGEVGDGYEVISLWPNTCPAGKEYIAGLCHDKCEPGYYRSALSCVAESKNVGIGRVLLLKNCKDSGYPGWTDTGLLCNEPLKWNNCRYKTFLGCIGGLEGGRVKTKQLSCDGYDGRFPDNVSGLCYAKCPPNLPVRIPGMPYLCYKGGPLMYTTIGKIPNTIAWNDREGGFGGN